MKKIFCSMLISICLLGCNCLSVFASAGDGEETFEKAYIQVDVGDFSESSFLPMNKVAESDTEIVSYAIDEVTEQSETYEAIIKITLDGEVSLASPLEVYQLYNPISPCASTGASEANTFWKAYITMYYYVNSSEACLTQVTGSWVQLRGSATLSNREVFYGMSTPYVYDTKYPTSNNFSYATGFSPIHPGRLNTMGCHSTVDVTLSGLTTRLTANVFKDTF